LGRDFSGPDARLGSFTPFLDSLIDKSLYWDNFLATQGRTFGVISSIFSSAPFGQHGLTDDERGIPQHNSFLNAVKDHGYQTRYYSGTDPSFDNVGKYFISQKIDKLFSKKDFDIKYRTANEWGYSDKELMQQVVEEEEKELHKPFVSIIQTITMHSPFSFMDDRAYDSYLDKYMNSLQISKNKYSIYMKDKKIYKTKI
jgi:phosphoglycerol transferase MdoB-like AlkP superfamily enzyme